MSFAPTSPVTGLAQTGLTSPTYTHVADQSPSQRGKQYAVTVLGGTQPGVTPSSVSSPFTFAMFLPASFQGLGKPNPVTGLISRIPRNVYKINTRKGVLVLAGQPVQNMIITTTIEVPAGADLADAASCRAALSCHGGVISQVAAGIGDTIIIGSL